MEPIQQLKEYLSAPKKGPRILIGCTGSVASIKTPSIANMLQRNGAAVILIPTSTALHFLYHSEEIDESKLLHSENSGKCSASLCENCKQHYENECNVKKVSEKYPNILIIDDSLEWSTWKKRGDMVLHIELRKWADLLLIAPLSANSLAKISNGICDNLLTCIVRAWDTSKPLLFCPAMNTHMYHHPLTDKQINIIKEMGYKEVPAISKVLMCGDTGKGAMASVSSIVEAVEANVKSRVYSTI